MILIPLVEFWVSHSSQKRLEWGTQPSFGIEIIPSTSPLQRKRQP
jgi:hypothetical protein